jgi:hypothetical protein
MCRTPTLFCIVILVFAVVPGAGLRMACSQDTWGQVCSSVSISDNLQEGTDCSFPDVDLHAPAIMPVVVTSRAPPGYLFAYGNRSNLMELQQGGEKL